ncbi:unnamed protein product [Amoebophrya sp. A25]|nr:unnamed protein product [Amoebophrya sp. A25]|eukprot:GSA25T00002820001.1
MSSSNAPPLSVAERTLQRLADRQHRAAHESPHDGGEELHSGDEENHVDELHQSADDENVEHLSIAESRDDDDGEASIAHSHEFESGDNHDDGDGIHRGLEDEQHHDAADHDAGVRDTRTTTRTGHEEGSVVTGPGHEMPVQEQDGSNDSAVDVVEGLSRDTRKSRPVVHKDDTEKEEVSETQNEDLTEEKAPGAHEEVSDMLTADALPKRPQSRTTGRTALLANVHVGANTSASIDEEQNFDTARALPQYAYQVMNGYAKLMRLYAGYAHNTRNLNLKEEDGGAMEQERLGRVLEALHIAQDRLRAPLQTVLAASSEVFFRQIETTTELASQMQRQRQEIQIAIGGDIIGAGGEEAMDSNAISAFIERIADAVVNKMERRSGGKNANDEAQSSNKTPRTKKTDAQAGTVGITGTGVGVAGDNITGKAKLKGAVGGQQSIRDSEPYAGWMAHARQRSGAMFELDLTGGRAFPTAVSIPRDPTTWNHDSRFTRTGTSSTKESTSKKPKRSSSLKMNKKGSNKNGLENSQSSDSASPPKNFGLLRPSSPKRRDPQDFVSDFSRQQALNRQLTQPPDDRLVSVSEGRRLYEERNALANARRKRVGGAEQRMKSLLNVNRKEQLLLQSKSMPVAVAEDNSAGSPTSASAASAPEEITSGARRSKKSRSSGMKSRVSFDIKRVRGTSRKDEQVKVSTTSTSTLSTSSRSTSIKQDRRTSKSPAVPPAYMGGVGRVDTTDAPGGEQQDAKPNKRYSFSVRTSLLDSRLARPPRPGSLTAASLTQQAAALDGAKMNDADRHGGAERSSGTTSTAGTDSQMTSTGASEVASRVPSRGKRNMKRNQARHSSIIDNVVAASKPVDFPLDRYYEQFSPALETVKRIRELAEDGKHFREEVLKQDEGIAGEHRKDIRDSDYEFGIPIDMPDAVKAAAATSPRKGGAAAPAVAGKAGRPTSTCSC